MGATVTAVYSQNKEEGHYTKICIREEEAGEQRRWGRNFIVYAVYFMWGLGSMGLKIQ